MEDTIASDRKRVESILIELRTERDRELQVAETERKAAARHTETSQALAELRRAIQAGPRPHWSQTPGFWVAAIGAAAAAIAAWPVIRSWFM